MYLTIDDKDFHTYSQVVQPPFQILHRDLPFFLNPLVRHDTFIDIYGHASLELRECYTISVPSGNAN